MARTKVPDQTWVEMYVRQKGKCGDCGDEDVAFDAHHMMRVADGGSNDSDNLVLLCKDCHEAAHNYGRFSEPIETTSDNYPNFNG